MDFSQLGIQIEEVVKTVDKINALNLILVDESLGTLGQDPALLQKKTKKHSQSG